MFGIVKRLKAILFILMTCFVVSGNIAFADIMPCSTHASHDVAQLSHVAIDTTHCSPEQMNASGSLHAEDCSSSHCPQCFSLIPTIERDIQPTAQSVANTPLVVSLLPNTHSPELRPPISF